MSPFDHWPEEGDPDECFVVGEPVEHASGAMIVRAVFFYDLDAIKFALEHDPHGNWLVIEGWVKNRKVRELPFPWAGAD